MTLLLAVLLAAPPFQVLGVLEFRDKVPEGQKIDAAYLSDQVRLRPRTPSRRSR